MTYLIEQSRGYDAAGDLYSPGTFRADLEAGVPVALVASVEDWRTIDALSPADALASFKSRCIFKWVRNAVQDPWNSLQNPDSSDV